MSLGSTTKDLRSVVTVLKLSFAEISKALTKSSAFFESFMLKFAKMLDVAIVYPLAMILYSKYVIFRDT